MGMKPGLETTYSMLARLGMPQMRFPSTHIAGSNGKGSTAALLANAHTLSGIRTGLFTSPHLCFVEERIRIDGEPLSKRRFDSALSEVREALQDGPTIEVTFFEATFLVAMVSFAEAGVQRAIIETGLGGRLDATRCCAADACVLTEIALEHTDVLGSDLATIAEEKAAIARPGVPLIARWSYDADVRTAIEAAVSDPRHGYWWRTDRLSLLRFDEADQPFRPLPVDPHFDGMPPMAEDTLMLCGAVLNVIGADGPLERIWDAWMRTVWPGRVQLMDGPHDTRLLLDCAHNPSGMHRLVDDLLHRADLAEDHGNEFVPEVLLIGATEQADLFAFLHPIIELVVHIGVRHIVIAEPRTGRSSAIRAERLQQSLSQQNPDLIIEVVRDPADALEVASRLAADITDAITDTVPLVRLLPRSAPDPDGKAPRGFVWAFGSLYLIGELLSALGRDSRKAMNILRPKRPAPSAQAEEE